MSSTTTMVMVKGMAWFAKHIHDWDYFVSLTGSDYPLMPLDNIEKVLHAQQPPMPFLMLWTSGVSKFMHRMTNMYPIYDKDATMKVGLSARMSCVCVVVVLECMAHDWVYKHCRSLGLPCEWYIYICVCDRYLWRC